MKNTALLVLGLALASCSKDDKSIRYEVDCTSCAIEYVRGDAWIHDYAQGTPILDTTFADTLIIDIDTVGFNETSWRMEFDADDDFAPGLKSRITPGNVTTARIIVDGVLVGSGSSSTYGEEVRL